MHTHRELQHKGYGVTTPRYNANGWELEYMDVRYKKTIQHHRHKDGRLRVTETTYDADGNVFDVTMATYDTDGILTQDQS